MTRSEFMKAFRSDELDLSTEDRREIFLDVLQAKSDITMELMQMLFTSFDVRAIRVERNPNENADKEAADAVDGVLVYACQFKDLHKAWRILAHELWEGVTPNPIDDIGMHGELLFSELMSACGKTLLEDNEKAWEKFSKQDRREVMRLWLNQIEPKRFRINHRFI